MLDAETKLSKAEEILDSYEESIGLPKYEKFGLSDEASYYIKLSPEQRQKLTAEDCAEAILILAQFSAHINRAYNREIAKMGWCKDEIYKTVGKLMPTYTAYSREERMELALAESNHAQKLESQRRLAESKAHRIAYMPKYIETIIKAYEHLSNIKRRNRENG